MKPPRILWIAALLAAATLCAQHNFTPADIEDGGRLFRANCVGCHGPDGDLVPGIDLGHGKFRRATTDGEIAEIIRKGIAGTPMPPGNYTEFQAATVVAHLRSMATAGRAISAAGDAVRGKALFTGKAACAACHRINGSGSRLGPDLSDIGSSRRTVELETSLLNPDAEVLAQNRYVKIVTKKGETLTGLLLNIDTFSVQLLDGRERLLSFVRSDLREATIQSKSPMPSYKDKLSAQELADLITYLSSLRGRQ